MDTETTLLLVIAGVFGLSIILAGALLFVLRPKGKVAEVQVDPDQPFELACVLPDDRPHKLWVRYSAKYDNDPENDIGLGIAFELVGKVGDEVVLDRPLGIGGVLPPGVEVVRGPSYWVNESSGLHGGSVAASKVLLELGPRPRGSAVQIRGTASVSPGTYLRKLKLWIGR